MKKAYQLGNLILLIILIILLFIYFESGTHVMYRNLNLVSKIGTIFWPNHGQVSFRKKLMQ